MKYCKYKANNALSIIKDLDSNNYEYLMETITNNIYPMVMDLNDIKGQLFQLKANKQAYKTLINSYNSLSELDKLTLVGTFYNIDTKLLENRQLEIYKTTHPQQKSILTKLVVPGHYYSGRFFDYVFAAKLNILTKDGVKLSERKKYSPEQVSKMQENGDIIILNSEPYKEIIEPKHIKYSYSGPIIHEDFPYIGSKDLNEFNLSCMKNKNPELVQELFADINLETIKEDYKKLYLPMYKKCLNYLVKCAEMSANNEQEKIIKLSIEAEKAQKAEEKFNAIKKQITDNSKGR